MKDSKIGFDFFQTIYNEVSDIIGSGKGFIVSWFNDEPYYIKKIKQGIVLYDPKMYRKTVYMYFTKPILHHQIASLRIQTHTRK